MPAAAHPRAVYPVQSLGDRGLDVLALQHLLRGRGHTVPADGVFGTSTQAAVIDFQDGQDLAGTGVVRAATWDRLVSPLGGGASGEAVVALQKLLNGKRQAGLTVNATFDTPTRRQVTSFQAQMGLTADGFVDGATWRNLLWHYVRPAFSNPALCNYNGGSSKADWGSASAVGLVEVAAVAFRQSTGGRMAIGDISAEHGGNIPYHATHEHGLDVDIALIRHDGDQCSRPGTSFRSAQYDRAATRKMLVSIRAAAGRHLKLIYFNDPVLIAEGLAWRYPHHDDHVHVRYCAADHALSMYRCANPAGVAAGALAPNEQPGLGGEFDPSAGLLPGLTLPAWLLTDDGLPPAWPGGVPDDGLGIY